MSLHRWLQAILTARPGGSKAPAPDVVRLFHPGQDAPARADLPMVDCIDPSLRYLSRDQTYLWCTCGHSRQQPFCDGSHAGTNLKPLRFTPTKSQTFWLCNCKYTRTPPYCDAAHNRLPEMWARRTLPDAV